MTFLTSKDIAQVSAAADRIQAMRQDDPDAENSRIALQKAEEKRRWTIDMSTLWKGADIEFKNVWFQYPSRNTPVLRGLSISIEHGQFAAIVGSSGSGKTTVISLLERFYDLQRGEILYNGENITSIPLKRYRSYMSLVAQEAYLFRGTIRENIQIGRAHV